MENQDSPNPEKRPDKPLDTQLKSFLRKAGPIIKSERGLNAKSRVKLESLARDMKLPEELFQEALERLQKDPTATAGEMNRWERAFAKRLQGQLKNLKGGILTASLENRAVQVAKEKYQLEELQAREIIQAVAKEAGIGRITKSTAEKHLDELVREKVGKSTWIDGKTRELLHEAGRGYGLSKEHIETVVAHYLSNNRSRLQQGKRLRGVMTAVITLGVVGIVVGAVVYVLSHPPGTSSSDADGKNGGKKSGEDDRDVVTFPDWWNESLQLASVRVRLEVDGFEPILSQITSSDSQERRAGYQTLVELYAKHFEQYEVRQRLEQLISSLIEVEPDPATSKLLIDRWLALVEPAVTMVAQDKLAYDMGTSVVSSTAGGIRFSALAAEVRSHLEQRLSELTGIVDFSAGDADTRKKKAVGGLVSRVYRRLIADAPDDPAAVMQAHGWIEKTAASNLRPSRRYELETQLALAVIPTDFDQWINCESLLESCAQQENPLLYRLITLAETSPNVGLQRFLLRRIALALEVNPSGLSPEELASKLRREIGVVPGMEEDENAIRWAKLRQLSEELPTLTETLASPTPPLPAETMNLMHVVSLAYAMAAKPSRGSRFDELRQEGAASLESSLTETPRVFGEGMFKGSASAAEVDRYERSMRRLKSWKSQSIIDRVRAVQTLATVAEKVRDIPARDASQLAEYFLSDKEDAEQAEINHALLQFQNWNHLLLAVADEIGNSRQNPAQIEPTVVALCGEALSLTDQADRLTQWKRQLLETVQLRISQGSSTSEPYGRRYNRLEQLYNDELTTRTSFLSSRGQEILGDSPSATLEIWLLNRPLTSFEPDTLDEWRARVAAINFVSNADLPRTVQMQEILLEQVAEFVRRRVPAESVAVDQLLDQFESQDAGVEHISTQFYLREWYQLQLLRLLAP